MPPSPASTPPRSPDAQPPLASLHSHHRFRWWRRIAVVWCRTLARSACWSNSRVHFGGDRRYLAKRLSDGGAATALEDCRNRTLATASHGLVQLERSLRSLGMGVAQSRARRHRDRNTSSPTSPVGGSRRLADSAGHPHGRVGCLLGTKYETNQNPAIHHVARSSGQPGNERLAVLRQRWIHGRQTQRHLRRYLGAVDSGARGVPRRLTAQRELT